MGVPSCISFPFEEMKFDDVASGERLQFRDLLRSLLGRKEMREAFLRLEIFGHRHHAAYLAARSHDAVLGLEQREKSGFHRQPGEADGVVGSRAPPERARHM